MGQSAPLKSSSSAPEEVPVENPPADLNSNQLEETEPAPAEAAAAKEPVEKVDSQSAEVINSEVEKEESESQISQSDQILDPQPPSEELPAELLASEQQEEKEQAITVADLIEEEENTKVVAHIDTQEVVDTEKVLATKDSSMAEEAVAVNLKAKKSQAVKAAELEQDWEDEGMDVDSELDKSKTKSVSKPLAKEKTDTEFTPRKSSRAPKPTEKKLESDNQKNLNTEDMEESVDAIAKELEKSDSEVKKAGKKDKSPKKGKKQQQDGESKEDWVALIFGENGEKVTEKGTPRSKLAKSDENKTEEIGPEAEEFLEEQTPFFSSKNKGSKKGGRPRKKDLDEKMDGVAKLGSNMYFYTGPGGADSPSSLHSDDEDLPVNAKKESEPARKSGRAGKGRNPRLEREDEVVDIPQVKGKAVSTPVASKSKPVTSTPAPSKTAATPASAKQSADKASSDTKEDSSKPPATPENDETPVSRGRAISKSDREARVSTDSMNDTSNKKAASPPRDETLPEFDPEKFTPGYVPKTVTKGDDEYVIVVSGVKDTGLCGGYWGNTENLGSRRRSKPVETLQIGRTEKSTNRRGSVGSGGSGTDATPSNKKTPQLKKGTTTTSQQGKSNKKQVTKPEKRVESMDSSQSESEMDTEQTKSRSRKRKNDDTPPSAPQEKISKSSKKDDKSIKDEEEEDIKASFSDDSG